MFINRTDELKTLNEKWEEKKAHFNIVYGKRRVGKTELIKQFIKDKPAVYFLADKRTELEQLKELGMLFGDYFGDSFLKSRGFDGWPEVFKYIKEKNGKRFIFVIDEYPYLVEVNKAVSSIFQKGWDEFLKSMDIFFILSGSSIAMMESELLIHKAPLYGRRTGQFLVQPLSFEESRGFFPERNFDEFLSIYAVTGGLPAYLLEWEGGLSFKDNIVRKVFSKTEFLHNEVEFVLKEEFREPKNYLSILKAISWGKRKFGEITNETGMGKNILTKYLNTLERLQIIEKEVPVTEKYPLKSRKGLYRISDNFFSFWFQYIFPHKSDLEIGRFEEVLRKINETFNLMEAGIYEKVCRELLWKYSGKIFNFERIGRWWEKEKEIDVTAYNSQTKEILFGEVKWSEKPIGVNIFNELKNKTMHVEWNNDSRKEYYLLCSKSGFTDDMLNLAKQEKVFLMHKDRLLIR